MTSRSLSASQIECSYEAWMPISNSGCQQTQQIAKKQSRSRWLDFPMAVKLTWKKCKTCFTFYCKSTSKFVICIGWHSFFLRSSSTLVSGGVCVYGFHLIWFKFPSPIKIFQVRQSFRTLSLLPRLINFTATEVRLFKGWSSRKSTKWVSSRTFSLHDLI